MSRIFFAVILSCLSFVVAKADNLDGGLANVEQYSAESPDPSNTIAVRYFAEEDLNIKEYLSGKARVNEVLKRIYGYGFRPKVKRLSVEIVREKMNGADIVAIGGKLFIALTATDENIEKNLLYCFLVSVSSGKVTYFALSQATVAQFRAGVEKIENVLNGFAQNGLRLELPNKLHIFISTDKVDSGRVFTVEGRLYISITANDDKIERYFMRYVRD